MKIIDKIERKSKDMMEADIPTIAFIGDSVTQGCFEVYMPADNDVETIYDKEHAYHTYVAKILHILYPNTPINIINAGLSGDHMTHGYERLQKDVMRFSPDLLVVSFGLNDATHKTPEKLPNFKAALRKLYTEVQKTDCELIFLTENMMNTYISYEIRDEFLRNIAESTMLSQNSGRLTEFFEAAKEISAEFGVPVCDVHAKWLTLAKHGVDTTALLSNRINHPTREMNWLFAYSLVETMMNN